MANAVIDDNVIYLGSNYYKIIGGIRPQYFSAFPQKLITGDYDYANQQLLSAWITNDQRGGIGIEEMDESVDTDRCWFSELILGYRRHLTLPRLGTQVTIPTIPTVPTIVNGDCELTTGWTNGARSAADPHTGTYNWTLGAAPSTDAFQNVTWNDEMQGLTVVFKMWVKSGIASNNRMQIYDGVGTTSSSAHSGGGGLRATYCY